MCARAQLDGALPFGDALREIVVDDELAVDEQQRSIVGSGIKSVSACRCNPDLCRDIRAEIIRQAERVPLGVTTSEVDIGSKETPYKRVSGKIHWGTAGVRISRKTAVDEHGGCLRGKEREQ